MRNDKRGTVMNKLFRATRLLALLAAAQWIAGCAAIAEKTNSLSDERIVAETAGVLGYINPPSCAKKGEILRSGPGQ
jgi:hypothetical protein